MEIIAGFDVSSTTIGWGILSIDDNKNIGFLDAGFIKPPKDGEIIERLMTTRSKVKDVLEKHRPSQVAIEDILKFMANRSSANTIITLSVFNRMVGLAAADYLCEIGGAPGKPAKPALYPVQTIRRTIKVDKEAPKKEDIPELVAQQLGVKFPYVLGRGGKVKIESNDVADGIAVALCHSIKLGGVPVL
jgi:Holliday junction resolvasome RuvABC endonuclease subunit